MSDKQRVPPRIMIGAPHGRSGKTVVSVGLCALFRKIGLTVQPFKKGPDYIDASWLTAASGTACRNLDAYLMTQDVLINNFCKSSLGNGFALIEGNMGLYDGFDGGGEGSTAHLARVLKTPVILVVNTARMTRSVAALIKGYMDFEKGTHVAGVILNNVAGPRHKKKLVDAVERYSKIPVLGCIPRNQAFTIHERHLGLVPFREANTGTIAVERILRSIEQHIDIEGLLSVAKSVRDLPVGFTEPPKPNPTIRIGILFDRAFHFYYPENFEALEQEGAELVFIDAISDQNLPVIDGLYIGGGFPELYLDALQCNEALRANIAASIEDGLPVYAECAGLMYLCEEIIFDGILRKGVGVIPYSVEFFRKPQAHGYVEAEVKYENPFYPVGARIRGHEFHHSRLTVTKGLRCALVLNRGQGIDGKMDGIVYRNVFASFTHIHASGTPSWARSFVSLASHKTHGSKPTFENESSQEVNHG
ncbi:MAG: cobyrinate a,c-diamide synthase [Syntrophorhabdus sp.]